jgi:uncharacterized OsmC-like protein
MPADHIKKSIEAAIDYLGQHPGEARYTDSVAVASLEAGLRFRISDPDGRTILSDMPTGVGGQGINPGPGWLLRAALASCTAALIAMRAAQTSVTLTKLEVLVDSESDDRGILGIDATIPAGPLKMRARVSIVAEGANNETLRELVAWAETHCPVTDAIRRPVAISTEMEKA